MNIKGCYRYRRFYDPSHLMWAEYLWKATRVGHSGARRVRRRSSPPACFTAADRNGRWTRLPHLWDPSLRYHLPPFSPWEPRGVRMELGREQRCYMAAANNRGSHPTCPQSCRWSVTEFSSRRLADNDRLREVSLRFRFNRSWRVGLRLPLEIWSGSKIPPSQPACLDISDIGRKKMGKLGKKDAKVGGKEGENTTKLVYIHFYFR